MSKTIILLVILVAIAAVAIGFYYGFSPFQTIQNFIQNPSEIIPKLAAFIQKYWLALAGAMGGFVTAIGAAARAYSQHKQETQNNLNQIKGESATAITQLTTEKQGLETQLTETTKSYSENFQAISENYVKLQGQLQDATALNKQLNKQLTDERAYYEERIKKLEAEKIQAQRVA